METRLGLFHTDRVETQGIRNSEFEGIHLGYIEKEDSIAMAVGLHTKNGSDRFAALVEIPTLLYTGESGAPVFYFRQLKKNNAAGDSNVFVLTNENGDIIQHLDKIIGKAVVFEVESGQLTETMISFISKQPWGNKVLEKYPVSCRATFNLLSHAWISPQTESRYGKEIKLNSTKIGYKLLIVESLQDVLDKSHVDVPTIYGIQYYLPDA
jgi:hypothetical protein